MDLTINGLIEFVSEVLNEVPQDDLEKIQTEIKSKCCAMYDTWCNSIYWCRYFLICHKFKRVC